MLKSVGPPMTLRLFYKLLLYPRPRFYRDALQYVVLNFLTIHFFSKSFLGSLVGRGRGLIQNALNMGVRHNNNTVRSDCVYRRDGDDTCPGEDILFHYYTLRYEKVKLYVIIKIIIIIIG